MKQEAVAFLREIMELEYKNGQYQLYAHDFLKKIERLGIRGWLDESYNIYGSVVFGPDSDRFREIVLVSHVDVSGQWFEPSVQDGNLYGRGVVESKGALAMFFWTLYEWLLQEYRPDISTRITVVCVNHLHDFRSSGLKILADQGIVFEGDNSKKQVIRPDVVLAGMPTGWQGIVVGHRGELVLKYRLDKETVVHGGENNSALNVAVNWFFSFSQWLRQQYPFTTGFETPSLELRELDHHVDGSRDIVSLDIRIHVPPDFDESILVEWVEGQKGFASVEFVDYLQGQLVDKDYQVIHRMAHAISQAGGEPVLKRRVTSWYLGNLQDIWRVPVVGYGPGNVVDIKTARESIRLVELEKTLRVFDEVLRATVEAKV